MPQKPTTFLEELTQAARGCVALLTGNRQAALFFDFSQRGLIGSFIALVIAVALAGFGALLVGIPSPPGASTQAVVVNIVACALQAGTAYLALRQMGRSDGLVPYLVATNWVALFSSIAVFLASLLGGISFLALLLVLIGSFVTFINIARLIVTLAPLQIAAFLVAQVVGVFLGVMILSALFFETGSPTL